MRAADNVRGEGVPNWALVARAIPVAAAALNTMARIRTLPDAAAMNRVPAPLLAEIEHFRTAHPAPRLHPTGAATYPVRIQCTTARPSASEAQ